MIVGCQENSEIVCYDKVIEGSGQLIYTHNNSYDLSKHNNTEATTGEYYLICIPKHQSLQMLL